MKKQIITILLLFFSTLLFGQSSKKEFNLGINYFGELGFRPGLEIDFGVSVWQEENDQNIKIKLSQINLRPSIAYYHYPHFSNNLLFAFKVADHTRIINKNNGRYIFFEPFFKIGYLRYFFKGDVFETTNNGFTEARFQGSNSFVFGGGFDFGGYLSKKIDWMVGFDYYAERTEDNLTPHRFVAKLGTRIKLNKE